MLPTISLGPAAIPTGPLTIILGMWLALAAVDRAARALNLESQALYGVASAGLFGGVIGARLVFVALHWSAYQDNLLGLIWPINSGYDPLGGLIIGLSAAFFYGRWRRLSLGTTLDTLAPGIAVGLLFVSLADLLAGPGYGEPTSAPWGISQFGIRRHPVQIYEVIVSLTAIAVWLGSLPPRHAPGRLFLVTSAIVSAGWLLVDPFRANAPLTATGYHVMQVAALAVLLASLGLLARLATRDQAGDNA